LVASALRGRDAVNGAFDIDVSQNSHGTNTTMKLLTVVSTVLLPATLMVGFFGTEFWRLHNQVSLDVMLALLVVVPAAVLLALPRPPDLTSIL
jgi:Mg2+ and Co2+ transporter CorA